VADWRDAAEYAPLLEADRSIFAWEWLRRDPCYRAAAELARGDSRSPDKDLRPEQWGLHVFEPHNLAAPCARPMWSSQVHDLVLAAAAEPADDPADAFDLPRLGSLAKLIEGEAGEHVLISDGLRATRLDVRAGTLTRGPVRLLYRLSGMRSAEKPLLTLRRLIWFCRSTCFSAALHHVDTRAHRFVLMLRAYDAIRSGVTQREIASALLSKEAEEGRWRVQAPTLRSRAQRLVKAARFMAEGGYSSLLASRSAGSFMLP